MKIGFVLDDGLDKPDGVQQYILTLGEWYTQHGHEVRYLVGQTRRTDIQGVYSLAKNIKVRFNGNALSIPLPSSARKIRAVVRAEAFDVIHVQVPYSPFMGAKVVAATDPHTAVIGTFHILPYGIASSVGTRLLGYWLKSNLRRFDHMVSVSQPAVDFAKDSFGVESTIIPNSVNMELFKPPKPVKKDPNTFRVLFVGRLVERKGCKQLLESLAILHNKGRLPQNIQVDICSGGPDRKTLEHFTKQNGLSSFVTFHGFVPLEQKIDLMQRADVSVFPSLSGESFGIVLIEAMAAAGGIVLAGDNPGYRSVLGELPDSMIDPKDPKKMAKQLGLMFNDAHRRSKLYRLQQEHVQQYDTNIVAEQLLDLYGTCKASRNT